MQQVLEEQQKLTEAYQRDADERRSLLLQIKELQEENIKLKVGYNDFKSFHLPSDKASCTARKSKLNFSDEKNSDEEKIGGDKAGHGKKRDDEQVAQGEKCDDKEPKEKKCNEEQKMYAEECNDIELLGGRDVGKVKITHALTLKLVTCYNSLN